MWHAHEAHGLPGCGVVESLSRRPQLRSHVHSVTQNRAKPFQTREITILILHRLRCLASVACPLADGEEIST
nr:MAG TPA: hypothetical protein [Caudoviricetes sp.]